MPIKKITIWLNAFIPRDIPGVTKMVPGNGIHAGKTMLHGPGQLIADCYLTDQRGFDPNIDASARMHSEIMIDLSLGTYIETHRCSPSIEVDCEDGDEECNKTAKTTRMHFKNFKKSEDNRSYSVELQAAASDACFELTPNFLVADIDYVGTIKVDINESNTVATVSFEGKIDPFPAYEMYAVINDGKKGELIFKEPPPPGNTPNDLADPLKMLNRSLNSKIELVYKEETNVPQKTLEELINDKTIIFDDTKHSKELREGTTKWLRQMVVQLASKVSPIRISSVTSGGHEKTSLHYKGRAIDIGNEEKASSIVPYLRNNASSLKIDELIFDATHGTSAIKDAKDDRNAYNLKNGKPHKYSDSVLKAHRNHIHVSVLSDPAERTASSAAAQKEFAQQAPHKDPITKIVENKIAEAHAGAASSGSTLSNISSDFFDLAEEASSTFTPSQDDFLDESWIASPSEGARLVLDMIATGTHSPETFNRSARAIYDIAFSEDDSASTIYEAIEGALGPVLDNTIKDNLGKIGLDPDSVDDILQLVHGDGGVEPTDIVVGVLRREISKHLPSEYKPILDIASALLFDSGQAQVEPVLRAVFGGSNQISNLAESITKTGLGAGAAVLGAANIGLTVFSMIQQEKHHAEVMKALESIKDDLKVIKQDLVDLKKAVANLSEELDKFSKRTEERFQHVLDLLGQGFNLVLQDTDKIKEKLSNLDKDMDNALDALIQINRLQEVHIAVDLQEERDELREKFANQLFAAFKNFDTPKQTLTEVGKFQLNEHLIYFFVHASVTAFGAPLSLGSLTNIAVSSLEDAKPLIRQAPAIEYAFGLLPLILNLSRYYIGPWHYIGPREQKLLQYVPDGLPNPVEFVRGTDAFLQLLTLAPADIQANYIEQVDILLLIAERIRMFLFRLRHHLDNSSVRSISIREFLRQTFNNYRNQHNIRVPILAEPKGLSFEVQGPGVHLVYLHTTYLVETDTGAEEKYFTVNLPRLTLYDIWAHYRYGDLQYDPIAFLQLHHLLTVEEIGVYAAKNIAAIPRYSEYHDTFVEVSELYRLTLRNDTNGSTSTALMLEYAAEKFGPLVRAIFQVDDPAQLASANVATKKFFEEALPLLHQYHQKHWLGIKNHVRATLEHDQGTIPAWEATRSAEWLIHRVRLHNDRKFSDDVLEQFGDPTKVGWGFKQRSDLLFWWDNIAAKNAIYDVQIRDYDNLPERSFHLEPKTNGMLPLVEACSNRLRGVGKTIDGKQRLNPIPNGMEFEQAQRKYPGDHHYHESRDSYDYAYLSKGAIWRYYIIRALEDKELWVEISGEGIHKDEVIVEFLDKERVKFTQHMSTMFWSKVFWCYPRVNGDVVIAVKTLINEYIDFGIGKRPSKDVGERPTRILAEGKKASIDATPKKKLSETTIDDKKKMENVEMESPPDLIWRERSSLFGEEKQKKVENVEMESPPDQESPPYLGGQDRSATIINELARTLRDHLQSQR